VYAENDELGIFMVAFQASDLPSSINSVEKVAAWAATVLQHLHPTLTVIEATGSAERAATASPFYIVASDPQTWRYIARQSLKLDPNWQRGTTKIWANVQDLSNQAIPTEFKS
jgi:hypothetical protein